MKQTPQVEFRIGESKNMADKNKNKNVINLQIQQQHPQHSLE